MKITKWIITASVILLVMAPSSFAEDQPAKQWVWLGSQGVWGYGYQIQEGPNRGLWRIDPGSKRAPVETAPASDPYGFAAVVNRIRRAAGLAPWLTITSFRCGPRTIMHGSAATVSATTSARTATRTARWNTPDAESVAQAWMNSPGHRANILDNTSSRFGIAFGPGPYWTMNTR